MQIVVAQHCVLDSKLSAGDDPADSLNITATSDEDIDALGVAAAISVSASSGTFSLSGAVGAAIASNTIGGTVEAQIADADAAESQSVSAGGPITVLADNASTIDAFLLTHAASVSAGSGTVNLSLAGAVSVTENTITSETLAGIDNSDVDSDGAVSIGADAGSQINANTIAVALSVAAGTGTVNLAGGFALATATNRIGGSTEALVERKRPGSGAGQPRVHLHIRLRKRFPRLAAR